MTTNYSQLPSRPKRPSKFAEELRKRYAKQQLRKVPRGTLPLATLDIPLELYVSFVEHLKSSTRILALFGAGLSAASGVPTFRGAGGFWREHDATELATPAAFNRDPSFAWQFYNYRRHIALKATPNRAHIALAKLAEKKPQFLAISQNIDNPLVPALEVTEECDISDVKYPLKDIPRENLLHCPQCQSLLRPAVVWFGEPVPMPAIDRIHNWLDGGKVDLMLVVGTSAQVFPAASYIHAARVAGARIAVFNLDQPEMDEPITRLREGDWFFQGDAGAVIPEVLKEVVGVIPELKHAGNSA
ncbi:MAG: hypothetical protein Q9161_003217 [Pseudevernia consocians]